jgi:hypothetical protein
MAGRKRRSGVWHHRVPDFKLVYCGSREQVPNKETQLTIRERRDKVSVNADEDKGARRGLEQQKTLG